MSCLDSERLLDFLSGRLTGATLQAAEAHVNGCESCRHALAALAAKQDETRPGPDAGSPRPEPNVLLAGDDLGRYMVLEQIGAGGMGLVYSAYDRTLDRRVALKQVRSESLSPEKRQELLGRLVREARAMARLSHPNVVAVHDAFAHEGEFFVAMEFIDGTTLRRWLREKERPVEEILPVFLAAGEGLKAAHVRGLVHRDFKPDNVLVGKDGRVCVTDFGLVLVHEGSAPLPELSRSAMDPRRVAAATPEELSGSGSSSGASRSGAPEPTPQESFSEGSGSFSEPARTRVGTLMGTPAYMPPEQRRGVGVDARSDQFSYCVSLYEALHGHKPGVAPKPGSKPRKVPRHLEDALRRGLAESPADRFPSMEALLEALAVDRRARTRRQLAVIGAVLGACALVALATVRLSNRATALCSGGPARVQSAWNKDVRAQLLKAFTDSGHLAAVGAFTAVERGLGAYTSEWASHFKDACEATRVRGEQTEALMDARIGCLEERLEAVDALAHVLARADKDVVNRSVEAVQALPPVRACQRPPRFNSGLEPPSEAQREAVAAGRKALAEASANFDAGRYAAAAQLCAAGLEKAKAAGYPPLASEWLLLQGRALDRLGKFKEADESAYQALRLAEQAGHQEVVVRARALLMVLEGLKLEKAQEAQRWGELAAAALSRLGAGHDELETLVALQHGALLLYRGENASALAEFERAAAIRSRLSGPEHAEIAIALQNQGTALTRLNRQEEAAAAYERSLKIRQATFGTEHILVAQSMNAVGTVLEAQGKLAPARERYEQAVEIAERTLGPKSAPLATFLSNLGSVDRELGALADAEKALAKALAIREQLAVGTPVADTQLELGAVLLKQGRVREAEAEEQKALATYAKVRGEKDPFTGLPLVHLAAAALYRRDPKEALALSTRAVPLLVKGFNEENARTALARGLRGQALVALGREKEALPELEQALKVLQGEAALAEAAFVRFALAQVLWAQPPQRPRALELARKAAADLEAAHGEPEKQELSRVKLWLARHGEAA